MVTLVNTRQRMQVLNLDHPFFRTRAWGAGTLRTPVQETRDGKTYYKQLSRSLPGALTLCAGEKLRGLPDQIQAVPDVRSAVERRDLRVIRE